MKRLGLLFIYGLWIINSASANQLNTFFCQTYLESRQKDSAIYKSNQCCRNVQKLIKRFGINNINIEKARVIFIMGEKNPEHLGREFPLLPLIPSEAFTRAVVEGSPFAAWNYHVLLEVEGYIYDLDAPDEKIRPLDEYFKLLFPDPEEGVDRLNQIEARVFSVHRFLQAYEDAAKNEVGPEYDKIAERRFILRFKPRETRSPEITTLRKIVNSFYKN
jgi:hypothetical protein